MIETLIHSIFGYIYLYWVCTQPCVWFLACYWSFLHVMPSLKCRINHSSSFLNGFIRFVHCFLPSWDDQMIMEWMTYFILYNNFHISGAILCWAWTLWKDVWLFQVYFYALLKSGVFCVMWSFNMLALLILSITSSVCFVLGTKDFIQLLVLIFCERFFTFCFLWCL